MERSGYLLAKEDAEARARLAALSTVLDPGTVRHLEERGVGRGWHCLEVGAGAASIASWLADRVGTTGVCWRPTSTSDPPRAEKGESR
jgi:hypothetical protein